MVEVWRKVWLLTAPRSEATNIKLILTHNIITVTIRGCSVCPARAAQWRRLETTVEPAATRDHGEVSPSHPDWHGQASKLPPGPSTGVGWWWRRWWWWRHYAAGHRERLYQALRCYCQQCTGWRQLQFYESFFKLGHWPRDSLIPCSGSQWWWWVIISLSDQTMLNTSEWRFCLNLSQYLVQPHSSWELFHIFRFYQQQMIVWCCSCMFCLVGLESAAQSRNLATTIHTINITTRINPVCSSWVHCLLAAWNKYKVELKPSLCWKC